MTVFDLLYPTDTNTPQLKRRVFSALWQHAQEMNAEDSDTPNHTAHLKLAENILANPMTLTNCIIWAVIGDINTHNDATDESVHQAVNRLRNVFAV